MKPGRAPSQNRRVALSRRNNFWGGCLLLPVLVACEVGETAEARGVKTVAVVRGDLMITAEATGSVEPIRRIEVKSKASGEILRLYVDVGDEVQVGDLLAKIDPRDVRNAFDQAKADLDVAEARFGISTAQRARSRELMTSGVISAQEHESRDLDFANSQAALLKAQTNMELAQLRLEDVTIRASIPGTILERNVEEGQIIQSASLNVSSGTRLMVMADLDLVRVRLLLDESEMGEIATNMKAVVRVDAYPGRDFVGTVDQIEPQAIVQQNVTLFPAFVRLDNTARLLKPGMNTEIDIEIAEVSAVLLIPNNALVLPQAAVPAAMVLGLGADAIDMRSMFSRGRSRVDGYRGPREEEGGGPWGDRARHMGGGPSAATPTLAPRRAVAFVVDVDGNIEPRMVISGWSDWDDTQVVSGLEEGERVALIGLAQLQAQQEAYLDRVRSRSSLMGPSHGGGAH